MYCFVVVLLFFCFWVGGWGELGGRAWNERGEARGCEMVGVHVCACVDAEEGQGQSEICSALLI